MKHVSLVALVLAPVLGLMAPLARAGLSISPPGLELRPGQQTAELRVSNDGEQAVSIQASLARWTQDAEGRDTESDSRDFVLYPKVFQVEPGKDQVLRVGRLPGAPGNGDTEIAYRLTLRELPVDRGTGSGVGVLLRLRLPVWLLPLKLQRDWSVEAPVAVARPAGPPRLGATVRNRGNGRLRLAEVVYQSLDADGRRLAELKVSGWYVLAGASAAFPVEPTPGFCAGARQIRVLARLADEEREATGPAAPVCAAAH